MNEAKYKSKYYKLRKESGFLIVTNYMLEIFFLDDISSDIYILLEKEKSIKQVADELLEKFMFDVEKEVLYQDVESLIEELLQQGLLEVMC